MTPAFAFLFPSERSLRSSGVLPGLDTLGLGTLGLGTLGLGTLGLGTLGLLACVFSSSTLAQTAGGELGAGAYQIGSPGVFGGISLAQDLSLEVPLRLGLYLHRASRIFPEDPANTCYIAAQRDSQTGDVTRLDLIGAFTAATYNGDGAALSNNVYSYPGEFRWGNLALAPGAPTTTLPLLCLNRTVVSTFVNKPSSWRLTALYQGSSQPLLVALRYPSSTYPSGTYPSGSFTPAVSAPDYLTSGVARDLSHARGATTLGWQDAFLLEGMLFEGGLPAQPLNAEVSFSIADLDIADLVNDGPKSANLEPTNLEPTNLKPVP